jgi:DNA-binding transcriptional regulator YiaG
MLQIDTTYGNDVMCKSMTIAEDIRTIRAALGEDTATFGARWHRSGRTVEDWEQGRRQPDPLVLEGLQEIRAYLKTSKAAALKKAKAKKAKG